MFGPQWNPARPPMCTNSRGNLAPWSASGVATCEQRSSGYRWQDFVPKACKNRNGNPQYSRSALSGPEGCMTATHATGFIWYPSIPEFCADVNGTVVTSISLPLLHRDQEEAGARDATFREFTFQMVDQQSCDLQVYRFFTDYELVMPNITSVTRTFENISYVTVGEVPYQSQVEVRENVTVTEVYESNMTVIIRSNVKNPGNGLQTGTGRDADCKMICEVSSTRYVFEGAVGYCTRPDFTTVADAHDRNACEGGGIPTGNLWNAVKDEACYQTGSMLGLAIEEREADGGEIVDKHTCEVIPATGNAWNYRIPEICADQLGNTMDVENEHDCEVGYHATGYTWFPEIPEGCINPAGAYVTFGFTGVRPTL